MEWFEIPRTETLTNRLPKEDIGGGIIRENLALGINLYHNVFSNPQEIINTLENTLSPNEQFFRWSPSLVNERENTAAARLCFDFKYSDMSYQQGNEKSEIINNLYNKVRDGINRCLADYQRNWNFNLGYLEAFNFVKYGTGEYFKTHVDHGPYNCYTTSIVVYLNDDYDGGEIDWIRLGLKVKPPAGSICLFPSDYVYEHESHLITNGIKYAVVVMSDYNDLNHGVQNGSATSKSNSGY